MVKSQKWSNLVEIDPLVYLLEAMNDERVPQMKRDRIAKKIAPYFHPRLKPMPAEQAAAHFESIDVEDGQEYEDEAIAARRESIRRKLFNAFD